MSRLNIGLFGILVCGVLLLVTCQTKSKTDNVEPAPFEIIAYYTGNQEEIEKYNLEQLTQIIYSFLHLKGNHLAIDNAADSIALMHLTGLKKKYPNLKVLVSLGGWGGCKTCSDVFNTKAGRVEFSHSVKNILENYNADGIDMDWEYPGIEGFPGHTWRPEGKENFTKLIQEMRRVLGNEPQISFAAGGFQQFFDHSIEWGKVMPLINRVNIMSYDLVGGYSTVTGHHTPLRSTSEQMRSMERGVNYLDSLGVPRSKMVVGAAFYARVWENVAPVNNGLYQEGKFKMAVNIKDFEKRLSEGFIDYWDTSAQAPYKYNPSDSLFATFDDDRSVALKAKFAREEKLGGIMFWELRCDKYEDGLLNALYEASKTN